MPINCQRTTWTRHVLKMAKMILFKTNAVGVKIIEIGRRDF